MIKNVLIHYIYSVMKWGDKSQECTRVMSHSVDESAVWLDSERLAECREQTGVQIYRSSKCDTWHTSPNFTLYLWKHSLRKCQRVVWQQKESTPVVDLNQMIWLTAKNQNSILREWVYNINTENHQKQKIKPRRWDGVCFWGSCRHELDEFEREERCRKMSEASERYIKQH